MTCRDVEALVSAYLDGELDSARSSALRGHLRGCAACRALADDHARIGGALADLEPAEPPPTMWDGVMARLADAERADARRSRLGLVGRRVWERVRPQLWPATAVLAAAAAAVAWIAIDRAAEAPPEADEPAPRGRLAVQATDDPDVGPPLPARPDPIAQIDAPARAGVDVEVALAVELARLDDLYATSVDELIDAIADDRAGWPAAQRRAYDAELGRLRAAVAAAPPTEVEIADHADPFEVAEAAAAQRERRERAWQRLVAFLQRAAVGEPLVSSRDPELRR
jgi:anti-sigma factor RsiW